MRLRSVSSVFLFVAGLCLLSGSALNAQISFNTGNPPNSALNAPYGFTFSATENCSCEPELSFAVTAGQLPGGLSLDGGGALTGTPTAAGTFNFTITVSDDNDCNNATPASQSYSIAVSGTSESYYILNNPDDEDNGQVIAFPGGTTTNYPLLDQLGNSSITDLAKDSSGNFIIPSGNALIQLSPSGNVTVLATAADGSAFVSVALDASGNYIVADNEQNAVWRVPAGGGTLLEIGTFQSEGENDLFVRVDSSGNYVLVEDSSDQINFHVFAPYRSNGSYPETGTTVSLQNSIFGRVGGMTLDAAGNYVITVNPDGTSYVGTVTPSGTVSELYPNNNESISYPLGITRDLASGNFLIVDNDNEQLFALSPDGLSLTALNVNLSDLDPISIVTDPPPPAPSAPAEITYVLNPPSDGGNTVIYSFPGGTALTCGGICADQSIYDFARDSTGNFILPAGENGLISLTPSGNATYIHQLPECDSDRCPDYATVALDGAGNYIVGGYTDGAVWRIPAGSGNAVHIGTAENTDICDEYVRVAPSGTIVLAQDTCNGDSGPSVQVYTFNPALTDQTPTAVLASPITGGYLFLGGLTFDASGNYVLTLYAETDPGSQIVTVTPGGQVTTLYSNPANLVREPTGITRDPLTGNFVFGDFENEALFQMPPSGATVTLLNTGSTLSNPWAVIIAPTASTQPTGPSLTISGPSYLGDFPLGTAISGTFTASNGTPPYTFSTINLPTGITFSGSAVSGTPPAPGTYFFTVVVTDATGANASTGVSYYVLGFNSSSLPNAAAYQPYNATVTAAGGVPPYTYSYVSSSAPAGITVSSAGVVSGVPTQSGKYSISITVTDRNNVQSTGIFSLAVNAAGALTVPGGVLTSVTVQTSTSQVLSASGGQPPYGWSYAAGTLPPGLKLDASGTLSGYPTVIGNYSFTVRATDSAGAYADGSYSISIQPVPLSVITPSPLAAGMATVDYPVQSIAANGGIAPYTFSVSSGKLPDGLTLTSAGALSGTPTSSGSSVFTITATDSSSPAKTGTANLAVNIRPFAPDLILSAGSLSFSLAAGSVVLPQSQTVQVESTDVTQLLGYTVGVYPLGTQWVSVNSTGTNTPGSFSVSLTNAALSLAASSFPYTASVVVSCTSGPCNGNSQTIPVTLSVTAQLPQLTVIDNSFSFDTLASAPQTTSQTLGIENSGGSSLGIASVSCGEPWCTVTAPPSAIGGGGTALLTVTANPAGLSAGYYWTDISIVTSAGSAIVPVTFLISADGLISLEPSGAEFTLPQAGEPEGNTSFEVTVSGTAPVAFTAQVAAGAPWLSVTPSSGTASGTQPAAVNLVFDQTQVAALKAGTYYATVNIASSGASNSPESFEVVLNVTTATQRTIPTPEPAGLLFLSGGSTSQTVTVLTSSPQTTGYQASATTSGGGNWLKVSPTSGNTSDTAEAQSTVTVNPSGLTPGVYTGLVNYAFSATAVRSVNVSLVVTASGAAGSVSTSDAGPQPQQDTTSCASSQIVPTSTTLVSNFAAPASWPIALAVVLVDNCGNAIGNGQVAATFSNADPPLILSPVNPSTGLYAGTWVPRHTSGQIVINARATAPGFSAATTQLAGAVTPSSVPVLAPGSTVNFYDPVGGSPLAPGTLVQISGQNLSAQSLSAGTIPLPTTLGGTSVIIGGIIAPISAVSPGVIYAQIPFELNSGQPYQTIVSANGALTTPDSFESGDVSPGLSILPNGYVQANHQDGTLVTDAAPAQPGEVISVYLVGMGATSTAVTSGTASPGTPLATVTAPLGITVNGESASFTFAGLAPGLVGVYQVNVTVPSDAQNGDQVLTLSENSVNSNSGILAVHN